MLSRLTVALAALWAPAHGLRMGRRFPLAMRAGSPVPQVYRLENPSLGCVLLAPKEEYNHFLREAAVFIYEWDSFADDTEPMAKGVIVDQVTAFELGEMAPALEGTPLGGNKLYTGGEAGNNAVIMMHEHEGIQGSRPIGNGLFVGGVSHAQELVGSGALPASDFKFFFNHCVWTRRQLQDMVDIGGWTAAWTPKELIMRQENKMAWRFIRSSLVSQSQQSSADENTMTPSALADGRDAEALLMASAVRNPGVDFSINIGGADDEDLEHDDSLFDFPDAPSASFSMVELRASRMPTPGLAEGAREVQTFEDDPSLYDEIRHTRSATSLPRKSRPIRSPTWSRSQPLEDDPSLYDGLRPSRSTVAPAWSSSQTLEDDPSLYEGLRRSSPSSPLPEKRLRSSGWPTFGTDWTGL